MTWGNLVRELDRWHESGRTATLWWRDDDARAPSGALDRLLELSCRHRIPNALSVVPDGVGKDLATAVSGAPVVVLQHGCRHVNRAPPDAKKCELVAETAIEGALEAGRARLAELFGTRSLPVLVPPWNRIDQALLPRLADLGYRGLSRFKPRHAARIANLHQVNTHVDIVSWPEGGFLGEDETLAATVGHLAGRRTAAVDPDEPTGLLTHHLDHDESCWTFIDRLFDETGNHPAVRWLDAGEIFPAAGPAKVAFR